MRGLTSSLLVAAATAGVANAQAVSLNVSSTPNAEAIPYAYGMMFEVRVAIKAIRAQTDVFIIRISTTPVMVDSTPS